MSVRKRVDFFSSNYYPYDSERYFKCYLRFYLLRQNYNYKDIIGDYFTVQIRNEKQIQKSYIVKVGRSDT